MPSHPPADVSPGGLCDDASRNARIRRYSTGVTWVLIVLCNSVFLVGIWVSGVNLDKLVKTPDLFNPASDICLRLTWQRLTGAPDPVRLCSEWINLSDPTGQSHVLDKETAVRQGADGRYYVDRGIQADYRLVACVLFVAMVMMSGFLIRKYLVARYRLYLESAADDRSTGIH
jgi:hypothetical protein